MIGNTNQQIIVTYISGSYVIESNTEVEILRKENDKLVIRGQGLVYSSNGATTPRSSILTLKVPERFIS